MTVNGIAYPADAVSGSPAYTGLQGRNSFSAAMGGASSARPVGGFTGVRPGTPTTTVAASSTIWGVGAFSGYIDLEATTTNSGYFFTVPATASGGAVTAAAASARVDLIYVQIADSNTGDGSSGSPRVIVDYQVGVAGAGVPALTAPRAFVIAQINVPSAGSPTVTWVAPYTAAAGGILPAASSSVYPAAASYPGQYLDDLATGTLKRSNGSIWIPVGGGVAPIIPTSVAVGSGSGAVGANGVVTFSGASSVSTNGCFTTTYDNYLVVFDFTTSAAGLLGVVLRSAGTDATTAYDTPVRTTAVNTTLATTQTLNAANWVGSGAIGIVGGTQSGEMKLYSPALAVATRGSIDSNITANPATTSSAWFLGKLLHRTTSSFDGFTFTISTGTATGNLRIYGLNNN